MLCTKLFCYAYLCCKGQTLDLALKKASGLCLDGFTRDFEGQRLPAILRPLLLLLETALVVILIWAIRLKEQPSTSIAVVHQDAIGDGSSLPIRFQLQPKISGEVQDRAQNIQ